jgi:hydroxylamine reductase
MFCNQCEQTAKGTACTISGACGKGPEVAALQDLLEYTLKGLSLYAVEARMKGIINNEADVFTCEALFSTLTNVSFDPNRITALIHKAVELRNSLKERISTELDHPTAKFSPPSDMAELIKMGEIADINNAHPNEDVRSLHHTLMYGIKGVAAYADHAMILGQEDEKVFAFLHEALVATLNVEMELDEAVALVLKCGEINYRAMELLDAGNTGTFGHPEPTEVSLGARKGKALLVSGHELRDLEDILKQTEGKGINVYTHGEMLPCNAYPALKKFDHLAGHYGTAWQNQKKEFAEFPGAIVMTTNCIQKPADSYNENLFTSGLVAFPGLTHIKDRDFTPAIERALALKGFEQAVEGKTVMTGFARNAVMGVADKVVEAVKGKDIRHFFLVAGCDGAKPGRNYYTELVEKVPEDCVVLTLACGKFRFFDKDLGSIGGIPRLLDIGQCNDAYSAIQIAVALAEAFDVGVNELPLSIVLSWYEQKAVAVLLTLLHLGIKNIRLGPTLPAFITPNVLNVLVENYNIKAITTAEEDLAAILTPSEVEATN